MNRKIFNISLGLIFCILSVNVNDTFANNEFLSKNNIALNNLNNSYLDIVISDDTGDIENLEDKDKKKPKKKNNKKDKKGKKDKNKKDKENKHVVAADKLFKENYYSSAIKKYKKAYSRSKKNRKERGRISNNLGDCYVNTGKTKLAAAQYKNAIRYKHHLVDSTVILKYADALRYNEDYIMAKEKYADFLELSPNHPLALAGLESCDLVLKLQENPNNCEISKIKIINSKYDDFCPTWDDQSYTSIIFTSARSESTGKATDLWTGQHFTDFFTASYDVEGKWSKPENADTDEVINTTGNEGAGHTNFRANRLYYTYCPDSKEIFGGCKIYVAKRTGGFGWSDPQPVQLGGDSLNIDGHPTVSPDELTIVFASDRKGSLGGKDLYFATRENVSDNFDMPINMGNIVNTKGDEVFPYFRNDTTLYFASDGHPGLGGLDIFRVYLGDDGFPKSIPENIGAPINSSSDDFGILFHPEKEEGFFTSNRKGGRGGDDIYAFVIPAVEFTVSGTITDKNTLQYVTGAIVKLTGTDGKTVETRTNDNGKYTFTKSQLDENNAYELVAEKDGYFNVTGDFNTIGLNESQDFIKDFVLSPIPEAPIVLPDILYEFGKWELRTQYQDSLQGLIQTLNDNPNIVIELASHTDMVGSLESNDILSQKRAESVVSYLIDRGINSKRLVAKGYGERRPRTLHEDFTVSGFTFPKGTTLTEDYIESLPNQTIKLAANTLNRRTEFTIISRDFVQETYNPEDTAQIADYQEFINIVVDPNQNFVNYVLTKNNKMISKCIANGYTASFEYEPLMGINYISQAKAVDLLQKGSITIEDFEGDPTQLISQGKIKEKAVINIKSVRFGNKEINDVPVVVNNKIPYDFLFNKKTLERVGMIIVDDINKLIIFE